MSHPLPLGFRAAGLHCGIKRDAGKLDLSLFISDAPAIAAGVFTTNRVCGAPVIVGRERVPADRVRAVLVNSGNANACTGEAGIADARNTTAAVATRLDCADHNVLPLSTGVIGRPLPTDRMLSSLPKLVATLAATPAGFTAAARGMMTTDTVPKQASRQFQIDGQTVTVAGAAKGAAMIAPNMATMLAVVMTDARLLPPQADALLRVAADKTFNRISVDGHTSTSDTVLLLANGAAEVDCTAGEAKTAFTNALDAVCSELAEAIINDAEGATHLIPRHRRWLADR